MPLSIEQLRERAKPWMEPISADKPTGESATQDPAYEALLGEVGKLDSVAGAAVAWKEVVSQGSTLLKQRSKDLRIATYVAYGLYATQGLDGLATGLVVLAELMDGYWPTLYPELPRLRGRTNALSWLVEQLGNRLGATPVGAADRERVQALQAACRRLAEVTRDKLGSSGPAMGPLLTCVERLQASLPAEPEPQPEPTPAPAQASPPPAEPAREPPPPSPPPQVSPVAPMPQVSSAPSDTGAVTDYLRGVGNGLLEAALLLRRANPADPLAYRLLRQGLWLHISQPPGDSSGRTALQPLAPALRERLERMAANGRWAELLEESESAMSQNRFTLELQHHSARALAELGGAYRAAREALLLELGALLRRMPGALRLLAKDGSPLTSPQARAWMETEVLASPAPATSAPGQTQAAEPSAAVEQEARALLASGKHAEAVALLQGAVSSATSGRSRFLLRLGLARLSAAAGQGGLARMVYESLDRECRERGLDAWEPPLASACLEGLLGLGRAAPESAEARNKFTARCRRLADIDPAAVLRIGL